MKHENNDPSTIEGLLALQEAFDKKVQGDPRFANLDKRHKLNSLANFMISESQEFKECLGFLFNDTDKWWKNHDSTSSGAFQTWIPVDNTNYDHLLTESIDMLHVLLSIWSNMGVKANDVVNAYIEKNKINFERQNNNY